jgi:20S proteasome subunit beta 4
MECLFGIRGADFCLLAADTLTARSIVVMKRDDVKFRSLTPTCGLTFQGESGDTVALADYLQANVQLFGVRHDGLELSTRACAHFARHILSQRLRTATPYQVNLLVGGVDTLDDHEGDAKDRLQEGQLFWIDYLGSMVPLPFACQGYGSYFCYGLLDKLYKPTLSKEDAVALLKTCLQELKTRFVVNLPSFIVRIYTVNAGLEEFIL